MDLALWDLLGKLRNEPVYALLGGKTKVCVTQQYDHLHSPSINRSIFQSTVPLPGLTLLRFYYLLSVLLISSNTVLLQSLGFVGSKIPCAYGPSEGIDGLKKNVKLFSEARQSVGDDFPLM